MINLLIDPFFRPSHWCAQYIKGIRCEAKRKNLGIYIAESLRDPVFSEDPGKVAILIGTSVTWLSESVSVLRRQGIRSVILSIGNRQDLGSGVSFVSMDYDDAMEKLLSYLSGIGHDRAALFAPNPDSATDQNKKLAYLHAGRGFTEDDVYHFDATLEDVSRRFFDNIDRYNAVICTNHISSIVLLKYLKEHGIDTTERIHVAAFGDLSADEDRIPDVTLVRIKAVEAGKLALRTVRLLTGFPELSAVSMNIRCDLLTRDGVIDSSEPVPDSDTTAKAAPEPTPMRHVETILMTEKILCSCDRVDMMILKGILSKDSYAKIARTAHISENTIGYRLHRLQQIAQTNSREDMIAALEPYLL